MNKDENKIFINVEDTGIGIPKERINKIFDKFYKIDESRSENKSFGIGLTIAKRIIDIHNGNIQVESVEGKYTKFTIIL